MGKNGTLVHCWWGCKKLASLWKAALCFLRRLNVGLIHEFTIPFLVYIPNLKADTQTNTCTWIFITSLFTMAKKKKKKKKEKNQIIWKGWKKGNCGICVQ